MNPWAPAVLAWIGVIFFSSTSIAAEWSETAFHFISHLLFRRLTSDDPSYNWIHLIADKGFHVTLFSVLAILLWNLLANPRWKIARILVVGAIVGSCSEFLQRFFPGRDPAVRDVLINIAGTGVGIAAMVTLAKRRSHTQAEALVER